MDTDSIYNNSQYSQQSSSTQTSLIHLLPKYPLSKKD